MKFHFEYLMILLFVVYWLRTGEVEPVASLYDCDNPFCSL